MLPPPASSTEQYPDWLLRQMERHDALPPGWSWADADARVLLAIQIASVRTWWENARRNADQPWQGAFFTTKGEARRALSWGQPTPGKEWTFRICWNRLFLQDRVIWSGISNKALVLAEAPLEPSRQRVMPAEAYHLPKRVIETFSPLLREHVLAPIPEGSLTALADTITEAIGIARTLNVLTDNEPSRRHLSKQQVIDCTSPDTFSVATIHKYFDVAMGVIRIRRDLMEIEDCAIMHPALVLE